MFVSLIVSTNKQFIIDELYRKKKINLTRIEEGKKEFVINNNEIGIVFYLPIQTNKQKNMANIFLQDVKTIMRNNKYNMDLTYSSDMHVIFNAIKKELETQVIATKTKEN